MKKLMFTVFFFTFSFVASIAQQTKHVILISIDGFRPEFYLDETWPAPNLQHLKKTGLYSKKMLSVFPSYTYPSHVAMLTGAMPARSGVYYNVPFDPLGVTEKWNWFTDAIKVPTLWSKLKSLGMTSAAIEWPVSVGGDITYNIPEIWDTHKPDDRISETRKFATKGLIEEVELNATGKLDSINMNEEGSALDENAGRMAAYIFKTYKPSLLAVHFAGVDGAQHGEGREGLNVSLAVAVVDRAVGNILEMLHKSGLEDSTTVIITGDHGFSTIRTILRPNVWLSQKQLIGNQKDWKVKFQTAGGSAFLYVQNSRDSSTIRKVRETVAQLPAEIKHLFAVYDRNKLNQMGVDSNAVLALAAKTGVVFSGSMTGEPMSSYDKPGGHHGYDPTMPEMYTGFISAGPGVNKGEVTVPICVKDISPFIAALLGIDFKTPDGVRYPELLNMNN